MYRIGIDVGGTNTDAVIINENLELVHGVKVPTSGDIQTGIESALHKVMAESQIEAGSIATRCLAPLNVPMRSLNEKNYRRSA